MNDNYLIPRHLDAPPLLFMWEADTAMIFIVLMLMGMLLQSVILGLGSAILVTRVYRRIKEEGGRGLLVKLMYWYWPSDWVTSRHPSHVREYYGG